MEITSGLTEDDTVAYIPPVSDEFLRRIYGDGPDGGPRG